MQNVEEENPFTIRDEVFFINYEDVIRTPYPFLLNKMNTTTLGESFKDFLYLDRFKNLNYNNLLAFTFQRTMPNILEELAKVEFDYNGVLAELKSRYIEMYNDSPLLSIGKSVGLFLKEESIKKIYIYSDEYDERIEYDIFRTYGNHDKLMYAYGDIEEVMAALPEKPTAFFLNDIDYVLPFAARKDWYEYCEFFIADYRYNYIDLEDSYDLEHRFDLGAVFGENPICKFNAFMPVQFEPFHVDQIAKSMGIDNFGDDIIIADEEKIE